MYSLTEILSVWPDSAVNCRWVRPEGIEGHQIPVSTSVWPAAFIWMHILLILHACVVTASHLRFVRRGQSRGRVSEPELFEAHGAIASN